VNYAFSNKELQKNAVANTNDADTSTTTASDENETADYVAALVAEKLNAKADNLDRETAFFTLGVDSILTQDIIAALEKRYENLSATLLFEHPNINALAAYLVRKGPKAPTVKQAFPPIPLANVPAPAPETLKPQRFSDVNRTLHKTPHIQRPSAGGYDIAVIGMSGRFPKAPDLQQYWRNLMEGKDCIDEIPPERWDKQFMYNGKAGSPDSIYGTWGGFLENIDKFDPLFFNISPKEAIEMDPQQRLFLQCVHETMECAGYGNPALYKNDHVGVFVGVMWNEYSILASENGMQLNKYAGPGTLYWAIPNRVSYCMDFKGPSIAVDTACSSSLTAIDQACQSIMRGDCAMALAGGVNLSLHPYKYMYLSQARFLSLDGRCRAFGQDGTGYVPGEGVGAILLKSLEEAKRSGDNILGVICGTSMNHGGKATGFTVPNPEAQAEIIETAIRRANISAEQISYLEAHGTGTSLGDPIEIAGLTTAYRKFTDRKQFCPIGSVKSNIGHLEAAAGIASIIKVLLGFHNDTIPKSIHSEKENTNITFTDTPFYVAHQALPWKPENGKPRYAGISSFGAGGSNVHVVIRDHISSDTRTDPPRQKYIFALSARNEESLKNYAQKFIDYLQSPALSGQAAVENVLNQEQIMQRLRSITSEILSLDPYFIDYDADFIDELNFDPFLLMTLTSKIHASFQIPAEFSLFEEARSLRELASGLTPLLASKNVQPQDNQIRKKPVRIDDLTYTLLTGRKAMDQRLCFVAHDIDEVLRQLHGYLQNAPNSTVYQGNAKKKDSDFAAMFGGSAGKEMVEAMIRHRDVDKLARIWAEGIDIAWHKVFEWSDARRLNLPSYPFQKKSFWIESPKKHRLSLSKLHPFIESNISDFSGFKFSIRPDDKS
ncbi:MAG: hypothetical protein GF398_07050, partial [Chitinivibrionales bacterium]|nr:hypothetical protein [Chitinivibrionales bacterium]